MACVRVVTANKRTAEATNIINAYTAVVPATKATAATIHATTRSPAPTIRQDLRRVRIPLTHAVAETISAAKDTMTNDCDITAAESNMACVAHKAEESQSPWSRTTTPTAQNMLPIPTAAVVNVGVSGGARGDRAQAVHD